MNEKILCIIPARGGSKGVKKKNVRPFNGKLLIGWTIEEAKKSKFINRVVVSTEDMEVSQASRNFGAEIIDRPEELAQDTSSTVDVVLHTLDVLKKEDYHPEYIILLQCTSPLRTVRHIDEAINYFLENVERVNSLISVCKEEHPPWWLKKIDRDGCLEDFLQYDKVKYARRQDFPDVFKLNGAIYIVKTKKFYEHRAFQIDKTLGYVMDYASSFDIDTETDFLVAEFIKKNM